MTERISQMGLSIAVSAGLLAVVALPAFSASSSAPKHQSHATQAHTKAATVEAQQSDGERKFNQNCSRCHKAPESFSPSVSGTILKHMRVRANLSQQDERDILRFLNP